MLLVSTKQSIRDIPLSEKILKLKKEKNALILSHFYQSPEIQEIADFCGDSLALAKKAQQTSADIILFAGVHFMAETAKILNPKKKVILPDLNASCSLAESCRPKEFSAFINKYPKHTVVSYINCSAEIKAMSDIICTSSNAEKIIQSIPNAEKIIFAPDKNLGQYLIGKTGREMLLWDGVCVVHQAFELKKILDLFKKYPTAKFIAHPESHSEILDVASYIGSTTGMIEFIAKDAAQTYIIATEAGVLHEMRKRAPHKAFIPAPIVQNNACACSECAYMKLNTLEKLYQCLKHETPEIILPHALAQKAIVPLERMLNLSI